MTKKYKLIIRDRSTNEFFFANRKPKRKFSESYDKYSTSLMFGDIIGYHNVKDEYTASEMTFLLLQKFKRNLRNAKKELKECLNTDPATIKNQHGFDYYMSVRHRMIDENTILVKKWTDIAKVVKASPEYIIELLTK